MKRRVLVVLFVFITVLLISGCSNSKRDIIAASDEEIKIIFKYGVGAKSELNTFDGTYTKDMVVDPPVTTNLSLSKKELDKIYNKMVEIDFFDYPDKFTTSIPPGEGLGMVTPHSSYYFKVEHGSKIKELSWEDNITNKDEKADQLRELIKVIRDIVESKSEYKSLPAPRGGYD